MCSHSQGRDGGLPALSLTPTPWWAGPCPDGRGPVRDDDVHVVRVRDDLKEPRDLTTDHLFYWFGFRSGHTGNGDGNGWEVKR